jgi:hypothetical protein
MRIAYFDCFSGISGDMILGALVDLGLDPEVLTAQLSHLPLSGYYLEISRESRGTLRGTRVKVQVDAQEHPHRTCTQILRLVADSGLSPEIKSTVSAILRRIASVEGTLHGIPPQQVHLHELGAVDSIVDIVGGCIALDALDIEQVVASSLPLGRGFVHCEHGVLPLPAPATLGLLEGVAVYDSGQQRELVTPTGAAFLTTVSSKFGAFPTMKIERIGYGVGQHPESHPPNLLRVVMGQSVPVALTERLLLLETSIDDMNPEFYGHLVERLLTAGALDVNVVPALMKKNRPGQLLRVLAPEGLREIVLQLLFRETTSLGVRIHEVERCSLPRRTMRVATVYGRLPVKVAGDTTAEFTLAPEYDACQRAARRHRVPLKRVYEEALLQARKRLSQNDAKRRRHDTEKS